MKRKILITCSVIIQILSILTGVFLSLTGEKVCRTGKCRKLSQDIQESMKTVIHPCDNFYDFSCGNYKKHDDIMSESSLLLRDKLIEILMKPPKKSEPRFVQLRKQLMSQCLDDHDVKKMADNVKSVIELVGGFPTVNAEWWGKEETRWKFEDAIGIFKKAGMFINMLVNIGITLSPFASAQLMMESTKPQLVSNVCDPTYQTELYVRIATSLGADKATAVSDINEIIKFENMLDEGIKKENSTMDDMEKSSFHSKKELMSKFDFLDWDSYLKSLFGRIPVASNEGDFIFVENEKYLLFLGEKFKELSKRLIANYMIWYNIIVGFTYVPGYKRKNWECLIIKDDFAGVLGPISNYLVLQMRDDSGYGLVRDMDNGLKSEMIRTINDLSWMDKITKQEAIKKVNKMKNIIGYPESYLNVKSIEVFYEDFKIGDNYFKSLLNLKKLDDHITRDLCFFKSINDSSCQLYIGSLTTPVDSVNAFYNILYNLIVIPDAIMKPPIFDAGWPKYINYGRIGVVVAHEITHGFDTSGAQYDYDGNKRVWWQAETIEKFLEKTQCFVDHFNKFQINVSSHIFQVDGSLSVRENIADAGGLNLAFKVYRRIAESRSFPELRLPYLDYTQEQLFLIAFAQLSCQGEIFLNETKVMMTDPHPPNPVRVKGSMQNFPFFGEVFGCSPGSEMNPRKKCKIW